MLAFTGDSRWRKAFAIGEPRLVQPGARRNSLAATRVAMGHDVPLVILAALSLLGGLLDLPWWHSGISAPLSWLDPVLGLHQHVPYGSVATRVILSFADGIIAIGGVAVAWRLWKSTAVQPSLEPEVPERAWYIDDVYDRLIARPSIALAKAASEFDRQVIDGAVVGTASAVRRAGAGLRKIQTGFVRQYTLGIVVGAVVLLAFMLVKAR